LLPATVAHHEAGRLFFDDHGGGKRRPFIVGPGHVGQRVVEAGQALIKVAKGMR
jgi:hypothetical protein